MRSAATTTLAQAKIPLEPYEITLAMLYTVGERKDSSINPPHLKVIIITLTFAVWL